MGKTINLVDYLKTYRDWDKERDRLRETHLVCLDDADMKLVQSSFRKALELWGHELPILEEMQNITHFTELYDTLNYFRNLKGILLPPLILDYDLGKGYKEVGVDFIEQGMGNEGMLIPTTIFTGKHAGRIAIPTIADLYQFDLRYPNNSLPVNLFQKTYNPDTDKVLPLALLLSIIKRNNHINTVISISQNIKKAFESTFQNNKFFKENPDTLKEKNILAIKASHITEQLKFSVYDFWDKFKEQFKDEENLKTLPECLKKDILKFIEQAKKTEDTPKKLSHKEENDLINISSFFEFIEKINLGINIPLFLGPEEIGENRVSKFDDLDDMKNWLKGKFRDRDPYHIVKNSLQIYEDIQSILHSVYQIKEENLEKFKSFIKPFQEKANDLYDEFFNINELISYYYKYFEKVTPINDELFESLESKSQKITIDKDKIGQIPFQNLQISHRALLSIIAQIKTNADKHDKKPSNEKKSINEVNIKIKTKEEVDEIIKNSLFQLGYNLKKAKNYVCIKFCNYENNFDEGKIGKIDLDKMKTRTRTKGNGLRIINNELKEEVAILVLSNENGKATQTLIIPTYIPNEKTEK